MEAILSESPDVPTASIIVPVGSVDGRVEEQVAAIACMDRIDRFEVVLACNSPSSADKRALERLAEHRGSRWRCVDASGRRGPAHARNVGAAHATGDLLLFCDADDRVSPQWASAMVSALERADAATGPLPPFGHSDGILRWKPAPSVAGVPTYMGTPYVPTANLAVRRAAFDQVGGFDERLRTSEDIAFSWSLLVGHRSIVWAPDAIVHRRYRVGVLPLLRQHVAYGRGISRVLLWYGMPSPGHWQKCGRALLRGSGEDSTQTSTDLRATLRRLAIAVGRVVGIVEVKLHRG